jgi:DNA-binding NarL/FixJ family response regulator
MVPFRGQCLVHRSQLEQAGGDWSAAMVTAQSACRALADPPHPALGLAYYQAGELHRLLGDGDRAADDFRLAGRHGYDPMPGLALLECERGEIRAASAMMQRAVQERRGAGLRPALLSGAVEIFRTTGDFAAARAAAESLSAIAARSASAALQATAAQATGSVLLADGNVLAALAELRTAGRTWQTLRMPYEAAKAAVLRGLACSAVGDRTSAEMEFDTARDTFTRLGALPDLEHVNYLSAGIAHDPSGGTSLSAREQEVLTHLVAGRSNREIAEKLVISPHTVARHVEHIYAKLGVTNRTAATAYAYEHHLV